MVGVVILELKVSYDDVAQYMFESLVELGYAPDGEEMLDLTDLICNYILSMFHEVGVDVYVMEELEDEE